MAFTKLTDDQHNSEALLEGLASAQSAKKLLDTAVERTTQAFRVKVEELGPPEDVEDDKKAIAAARAAVKAAQDAKAKAEADVLAADQALEAERAKKNKCDTALAWAIADREDCEDELQEYEGEAAKSPAMSGQEREWYEAFAKMSDTPPDYSLVLKDALDKAQRACVAAQADVDRQAEVVARAEQARSEAPEAVDAAQARIEAEQAECERIVGRLRTHSEIAKLRAAVDSAIRDRDTAPETGLSMAAIMAPYKVLLDELNASVAQLKSEQGIDDAFKNAVEAHGAGLPKIAGGIDNAAASSDRAAEKFVSQLGKLAALMNKIADDLDEDERVGLAEARHRVVSEGLAKELADYGADEDWSLARPSLDGRVERLKTAIKALDASDWNSFEQAARDALQAAKEAHARHNKRIEDDRAMEAQKRVNFDLVNDELSEALGDGILPKRKYHAIREAVRSSSVSLDDFNAMVAEAQQIMAQNDARRLENEAGEFYTASQWRTHLGLTGSKSDWGMIYHEYGEEGGKKWNLHYSVSNDSIAESTGWIRMRGANADEVFKELFIRNTERKFRMHATFTIAGQDANAHLYLGDTRIYYSSVIPSRIWPTIKDKLKAMEARFIQEKTAIITSKIL